MRDALRTNDPVQLSFGESVLEGAGIFYERTDPLVQTYASLEPTPGCLIVEDRDYERAVALLKEAFGNDPIR